MVFWGIKVEVYIVIVINMVVIFLCVDKCRLWEESLVIVVVCIFFVVGLLGDIGLFVVINVLFIGLQWEWFVMQIEVGKLFVVVVDMVFWLSGKVQLDMVVVKVVVLQFQ